MASPTSLRWGEHRGGMFVVVEGSTEDGPIERSWHLLVEGDDGPFIPSMTCEVILRRCLAGRVPAPGARSAAGELSLAEYEAPFARRAITTGTREIGPENQPPAALSADTRQRLRHAARADQGDARPRWQHDGQWSRRHRSRHRRSCGTRLPPLFGFPKAGRNVAAKVRFGTNWKIKEFLDFGRLRPVGPPKHRPCLPPSTAP